MTENLCTLDEIKSRVSINALKQKRKEIKSMRHKIASEIYKARLDKVNALIEGKQHMYFKMYQTYRGFKWASLGRRT